MESQFAWNFTTNQRYLAGIAADVRCGSGGVSILVWGSKKKRTARGRSSDSGRYEWPEMSTADGWTGKSFIAYILF